MRKNFLISLLAIVCLSILLFLFWQLSKNAKFYLDSEYYGKSTFISVKYEDVEEMINDQKTFVLFVYQPACTTSADFEDIIANYSQDKNISILKIAFSEIKDTPIGDFVKYYPSFVIYHKGKVVDYLDAQDEEDKNIYKSLDGFTSWLEKYIRIKNVPAENNSLNNSSNVTDEESPVVNPVKLENIQREKGKVNVYFFWGDGCPHCAQEFKLWESLAEEYSEYYNLYTFEVWYNKENADLLTAFSKAMGDKIRGIPYTIIGSKSFEGYDENTGEEIKKAILEEKDQNFDIYFDKLK